MDEEDGEMTNGTWKRTLVTHSTVGDEEDTILPGRYTNGSTNVSA